MSPLRFTTSLILSTFTMLKLLLSAWSWTERIQPCVDYISKWPQQRERGEAGVNLCPQESTSGWGWLTAKHKPSLTHAHLLALEQKRLRTQRATAGHKSELQTHLTVQTTGEKKCKEHQEIKRKQYLHPTRPSQQKKTNISMWSLQRSLQGFLSKSRVIQTGLSYIESQCRGAEH